MAVLALLVLALAPGLFWLWYFYRKDVFQPEPKRLVLRTFLLGMLVVVPVALVEALLLGLTGFEVAQAQGQVLGAAAAMLLVVGPVEEYAKFWAVQRAALRSHHFDEPVDGIVYAAAAALGFASLENAGYMLSFGWEVILLRGPVSTLGHVLFSGLWGYALGRALVVPGARRQVLLWLAAGAGVHGLFNFLLFAYGGWGVALAVALLAALAWWLRGRIAWAQRASPFHAAALRFGRR